MGLLSLEETDRIVEIITWFVFGLSNDIRLYVYDDVVFHEKAYWIPKYLIVFLPIYLVIIFVNTYIDCSKLFNEIISDGIHTMDELMAVAALLFVLVLAICCVVNIFVDHNSRTKIKNLIELFFFNKEFKEQYKKKIPNC